MRNISWKVSTSIILCLAAASMGGGSSLAQPPSRLEQIPGSDLKRVVLTPKAAQRLAIKTTKVSEAPVLRWLTVEGRVEAMPAEPSGTAAAAPRMRVELVDNPDPLVVDPSLLVVSLKSGVDDAADADDDDDDQKKAGAVGKTSIKDPRLAVVTPIGPGHAKRFAATPVQVATAATGVSPIPRIYELTSADHGLRPGQRVQVRVPRPGSGEPRRVIPYSAVIYDVQGNTWAYTNPEPLVFVRSRIDVEFIEGRRAVLKDGPATGTVIVTAGGAVLLGVEQKFGQ
jgi:hypothetical protein